MVSAFQTFFQMVFRSYSGVVTDNIDNIENYDCYYGFCSSQGGGGGEEASHQFS